MSTPVGPPNPFGAPGAPTKRTYSVRPPSRVGNAPPTTVGAAAPPQFDWKKPTGTGIGEMWKRMTDVRSWYCHLTAGLATFVACLIIFVTFKPKFLQERTEEGLPSEKLSLAKLFVVSLGLSALVVGLGIWANGLP
jgi:hypothetical protein